MSSELYFALIGDIVSSRDLPDRASVQRRVRHLIEQVNGHLPDDAVQASLHLTAGDELQALLVSPETAVEVPIELADGLHPVRLVWGLGAGTLSTEVDVDASVMDGPCFHRAREGLEAAANDDAWLRANGFGPALDDALSALFRLMGAIRAGWTDKQARTVRAARDRLQKEVAADFDVSPSVVSESLKAARFREIQAGEAAVRHLARWFVENDESTATSV